MITRVGEEREDYERLEREKEYRRSIEEQDWKRKLDRLDHLSKAMAIFEKDIALKFQSIQTSISAHALGVQNVYNELKLLKDRIDELGLGWMRQNARLELNSETITSTMLQNV